MNRVDLCTKYRPASLKDVYLQTEVTSYLRSVVQRPDDSVKYIFLSGAFGCGKTSVARAFAHDLLKLPSLTNTPQYIEIDSSEKRIAEDFDSIKNYIFSEVNGWKVVTIDECHLLPAQVQQKLLKVLEDYTGKLFILFMTTDDQLVTNTLKSRCIQFNLHSFTVQQCCQYGEAILEKEGYAFSKRVIEIAALNCRGHLRDLLKQLEIAIFQGEDYFLKTYTSLWKSIEDYFFNFNKPKEEVLQQLLRYHVVQLKSYISAFMLDNLVKESDLSKQMKLYSRQSIPKIYQVYLKFLSMVNDNISDEYYSFLYVFRDVLDQVRIKT